MSTLPKNTSERVIEEHYLRSRESYLIYLMHVATYNNAIKYISGKEVLDLGCGTGYGTALVADKCASICGVDISDEAIAYATNKYSAPHLFYRTIRKVEDAPLPFGDKSFDVVLSFQVIEHIADPTTYLEEIGRVLRPGGVFIVATPDRNTRLLPLQRPWNKFHVHEYSGQELVGLVSRYFGEVKLVNMSGTRSVLDMELIRTKWLMWLTLPFTIPLVPETFRILGLDFLMRLRNRCAHAHSDNGPSAYEFDINDIHIGEGLSPSVNLIAIARKL
jgi:SAM-dependent methyltransferase